MTSVKKGDTVISVGTRKGLFLFHSKDRKRWAMRGPSFEGVAVNHAILDPRDGRTIFAGVTSMHWGPTVQRSTTFGEKWLKDPTQPKFPEGSGLSVTAVWHVKPGVNGEVYAGVEPGGLFRSDDGGASWVGVEGLNAMKGRDAWTPGGGGLCLHTVLPHPTDARRLVVAISAVGIFESRDAGVTWHLRNGKIRHDHLPEKTTAEDQMGTCPHKLVRDATKPGRLFMQNHWGVYKREEDAERWTDINKGLPSRFGFPMAAHPHDSTIYTVPLVGDYNRVTPEGQMAVWRGEKGGKNWTRLTKGLPKGAFLTVLREGLATDEHDPAGVYVGTTGGHLYASRDEGRTWSAIAEHLPPILSVEVGIAR